MDEFADLRRLNLSSRLKRISDYIFSEVNAFYKENGIEFEASTFPLLRVVHEHGPLSLREAEHKLGVTHAAISQKAKVLHKHGLISMRTDKKDQRSKLLALTEKGGKLVLITRPCWEAMDRALAHMLFPEEQALFQALRHFEEQTSRESFRHHIYKNFSPKPLQDIKITGFGIGMKQHFRRLNEDALSTPSAEAAGEAIFENPRQAILDKGGEILFAEYDNEIVGTCALLPEENGNFEIAHVGIDPRYRGRGLTKALITAAIDKAREKQAKKVFLTTSSHQPPALQTLRSLGFEEVLLSAGEHQHPEARLFKYEKIL